MEELLLPFFFHLTSAEKAIANGHKNQKAAPLSGLHW
jgi:hypothetical protein